MRRQSQPTRRLHLRSCAGRPAASPTRARFSNGWAGPYATRDGTWPGNIQQAGDTLRIFVKNPPSAMQQHPKWPCFHKHDNSGWWRIHLHTYPVDGDPNAIIRYVEQILTEACKRSSKGTIQC